jgi:hypothetical protein
MGGPLADYPDFAIERGLADREPLLTEVARFAQDALVSRLIDLGRVRELLEHWPRDVDPARAALYRGGVGIALMTGRFLMWFQAGARPSS